MAGGVGQRFWPRSRRRHPKQLLDLTGRGSMIMLTVERLKAISSPEEIFIITNRSQRAAIETEIAGRIPSENIISEPVGRNTSAAICLAAALLKQREADSLMLVLPADHLIEPTEAFEKAVRIAASYVSQNRGLLTFGIQPIRPETGYGYIHVGERVQHTEGLEIYRARAFLEKPDLERAKRFCEEGTYLWNSGMFLWKTDDILEALKRYLPDLFTRLDGIGGRSGKEGLDDYLEAVYPEVPSISIDYGVMEKAENVVVLKPDFLWNDIGSWEYLRDVRPLDKKGNAAVGEHIFIDSSENTVFSPDRLIGMIGVDNLVVVDGGDSMLICRRDRAQEVREIVENLKKQGREQFY